jgi:hypothetical protein
MLLNTNATDKFLRYGLGKNSKFILQELQIDECCLLKQIKPWKMKYFGHIKCHEGLDKRIIEGYIPERRKE